jgi:hypothetical protein
LLYHSKPDEFVKRHAFRPPPPGAACVFCGIDIHNRVIEIHIPDFNIYKTVLTNSGREQKIDNYPTATGGKDVLADIGLWQGFLQFGVRVGLDGGFLFDLAAAARIHTKLPILLNFW